MTNERRYLFDPKCYELAEYFLPTGASARITNDLAQAIQDAVEDYCVGEAVTLQAVLSQPPQKLVEVYVRSECIFRYCPNESLCKQADQCQYKK